MKVYVVTETSGEYSSISFALKAVFSTRELAEDYCAKMAALPGIKAEYPAGSENEYDIEEMDVWEVPTERYLIYKRHDYVAPGAKVDPPRHDGFDWRNEEYAPPGYEGFWHAEREWEPETGWSTISVGQPTPEQCAAEVERLMSEQTA